MSGKIVPSKLHRIRVFEALTVYRTADRVQSLDSQRSDCSIEKQVHDWVDQTGALIVGTGPLSLSVERGIMDPDDLDSPIIMTETRVLPVIYVPAVEQPNDDIYGQQEQTTVGSFSVEHEPEDTGPARRVSDGPRTRNRRIRLFIPAEQVKRANEDADRADAADG